MNHDKVSKTSINLAEERLQDLQIFLPEAFREGQLDVDALKAALSLPVSDSKAERFSFTWAGKRNATRIAQASSRATLVPVVEESVNWDTTNNIFIEGDNLEVLKLIGRSYFGEVKMIYIDPPYNTGNDFVYPDNYSDPLDTYLQMTGQVDTNGNRLTSNTERSGRFHSSWLSMMYPRLLVARQLLRDDGVIFVSIDDNELHNLLQLMNEVFGEENFVGQIAVQLNPRGRHLDKFIARTHEYLIIYARNISSDPLYGLEKGEAMIKEYNKSDEHGKYRELELRNRNPAFNSRTRPNLYYPIYVHPATGAVSLEASDEYTVEVYPQNSSGGDSCWTWGKEKFRKLNHLLSGRQTTDGGWRIFRKDYLVKSDGTVATTLPKSLWLDKEINNDYGKKAIQDLFDGETVFDFPKAPELIKKMIQISTDDGDIILDFFAGSSTTAHAVMELNEVEEIERSFIMIQFPEPLEEAAVARKFGCKTIADVGRERIRRLIRKLQSEKNGKLLNTTSDLGFRVFKLVPSNYRQWQPTEDTGEIMQQLELMAQSLLVDGWKPEDVIFEVAIKEGYGLNAQIDEIDGLGGNTVYRVTDPTKAQTFYICLDEKLPTDLLIRLGLTPGDLFICMDSALNDTLAANFALQARLKTL
jgi:adenine-specific DNA-methyltransferase